MTHKDIKESVHDIRVYDDNKHRVVTAEPQPICGTESRKTLWQGPVETCFVPHGALSRFSSSQSGQV